MLSASRHNSDWTQTAQTRHVKIQNQRTKNEMPLRSWETFVHTQRPQYTTATTTVTPRLYATYNRLGRSHAVHMGKCASRQPKHIHTRTRTHWQYAEQGQQCRRHARRRKRSKQNRSVTVSNRSAGVFGAGVCVSASGNARKQSRNNMTPFCSRPYVQALTMLRVPSSANTLFWYTNSFTEKSNEKSSTRSNDDRLRVCSCYCSHIHSQWVTSRLSHCLQRQPQRNSVSVSDLHAEWCHVTQTQGGAA